MRLFDLPVRSDNRETADLQNLAYFGTERMLAVAHAPRRFERAEDLLAYLQHLCGAERARIEGCGITCDIALGILPAARPRRAHFEIWERLPALLQRPEVVALGECGVYADRDDHWELFDRQVELAQQLGLPLVLSSPHDLRANMTYKMMRRLEELGFPPARALLTFLDARLVETVLREGFAAQIAVGPLGLGSQEACEVTLRALEARGSDERLILGSGLRAGAADILALPKMVDALEEAGLPERSRQRLFFENALTFLEPPEAT